MNAIQMNEVQMNEVHTHLQLFTALGSGLFAWFCTGSFARRAGSLNVYFALRVGVEAHDTLRALLTKRGKPIRFEPPGQRGNESVRWEKVSE